ncbi:MAG: hypothetical protein CG439_389 [Methylococcaceae bacterium NSP1-2]|nr:MAG: hypothetical protein CG439_389 [Methylococcaceae bacterium NSP1-2]
MGYQLKLAPRFKLMTPLIGWLELQLFQSKLVAEYRPVRFLKPDRSWL